MIPAPAIVGTLVVTATVVGHVFKKKGSSDSPTNSNLTQAQINKILLDECTKMMETIEMQSRQLDYLTAVLNANGIEPTDFDRIVMNYSATAEK